MKRQTYLELVKEYLNVRSNNETFEAQGLEFPYPDFLYYGKDIDANKSEYRTRVWYELQYLKTEEELRTLPLSVKVRRYGKNIGLEMFASGIEGLNVILCLGGVRVNCDVLRDRKEQTYYEFRKRRSDHQNGLG